MTIYLHYIATASLGRL